MNKLSFIIFIIIALSVYFGLHFYVYIKIVHGLDLSLKIRLYLVLFFIVAGLSFFLKEFLRGHLLFKPLIYFGNIWLGVIAIAFTIFILKDIIGLFLPHYIKLLTQISLCLLLITTIYSLYNGTRAPAIKTIKLPIKKLKTNFSIVQLSDIHLGPDKSIDWLKKIINTANQFSPDLIVITGDLIDEGICEINGLCNTLKELKAKYGVYAITGNHEYYAGVDKFLSLCKSANIIPLRNSKITINNEIELAGVDDITGKRYGEKGTDIEGALQNVDIKKPIILLNHQPLFFKEAIAKSVDLQLSGHTHNGQVPPLEFLTFLVFKYYYGLFKINSSYLYTTSGTGTWGPPMRVFSRSEIVYIQLLTTNEHE